MQTAKTLIRLGGCPGWSESSLGAQSLYWFCHVAAHIQVMFMVAKWVSLFPPERRVWFKTTVNTNIRACTVNTNKTYEMMRVISKEYILTDRNNPSVILSEVFWWKRDINLLHLITVYLHVRELWIIEVLMWLLVMLTWLGGNINVKTDKKICFRKNIFFN